MVRSTILEIVPDAEQGLSRGAPALKNHLTYAANLGTVTAQLTDELVPVRLAERPPSR